MEIRVDSIEDSRKIRCFHLKKQFLFSKALKDQSAEVLDSQLALHSTDYLTPYLSLWARVEDFNPESLLDDLCSGSALRIRAFRGTVFVVGKNQATELSKILQWTMRPRINEAVRILKSHSIDYPGIESLITKILENEDLLTTAQIRNLAAPELESQFFTLIMRKLELSGSLTRGKPRYLSDRIIRWKLSGPIRLRQDEIEERLRSLTLKYIKTFGPICLDDLSWWLPVTKTKASELIHDLSENLVCFPWNQRTYWMESNDYQQLMNIEPLECSTVNLLPYEDHFTKSYIIRNWFLRPENEKHVTFEGRIYMGQIQPSILVDGEIIGRWIWTWEDKKKTGGFAAIAELQEDPPIKNAIKDQISVKLAELETFMNEKIVPLINRKN